MHTSAAAVPFGLRARGDGTPTTLPVASLSCGFGILQPASEARTPHHPASRKVPDSSKWNSAPAAHWAAAEVPAQIS